MSVIQNLNNIMGAPDLQSLLIAFASFSNRSSPVNTEMKDNTAMKDNTETKGSTAIKDKIMTAHDPLPIISTSLGMKRALQV